MDFLIEPKPFQDVDQLVHPIVRLRGKVILMPFTLEDQDFAFMLYFEFLDETGRPRSAKNADRQDLQLLLLPVVQEAMPTVPLAEQKAAVNAQINQLLSGLLLGTKLQRYQAAQLLASNYQMKLKPLDEQNVIPTMQYPSL